MSMDTSRATHSTSEVATETGGLLAGFGIITAALFPFALPGLLLVVAPLALVALAGVVLALPIVLPLWLVRSLRRRLSARERAEPRRQPTAGAGSARAVRRGRAAPAAAPASESAAATEIAAVKPSVNACVEA
jgi:hypothetical protein